ncbi:MAG TPA: aminotransferase class I/II-fold pyridoxal phosphate-dependent enzyme, partial [Sphaerochaeta sp.]|nr:aminotransferase class I/II-fold pyridoxal phosphate-dependent enzyme [Sphaerochaeta sp.]
MKMSNRISSFQASPIRRLSPYARSAVKRGITVYHLNIGQPDIKTPQVVLDAIRSYNEPIIAYGSSEGDERLRNALPAYYATYGVDIKPEDILITTGGSEALLFTLMTLCDPGDQVIIPEPFYTNVSSFAHSAM